MKLKKELFPSFPKARCKNADPGLFHGDDKRDREPHPEAAKLCALCEHSSECLAWAMLHKESGVWGGTTVYQRAALLREFHRVRCPGCGGYDIYGEEPVEICLTCGLSWRV